MDKYDAIEERINSHKQDIVKAITKAFISEGVEIDNLQEYVNRRVSRSKVFIWEKSLIKTEYEKEVDKLIDSISEIAGYNVRDYVFKKVAVLTSFRTITLKGDLEQSISGASKLYNDHSSFYGNYGIGLETFEELYSKHGEEGVNNLNKLLIELKKKMRLYNLKKNAFATMDCFALISKSKKMDKFLNNCGIDNFDELLDFRSKLVTAFMDKEMLEERYKDEVNESKDYLLKRFARVIEKKEAKKIIESIDGFINNNLIKEMVAKTNILEFFEKNNYQYDGKVITEIINLYFHTTSVSGVNTEIDFKGYKKNFCMFNDNILNYNFSMQNDIIIHEFIHSLETKGFNLDEDRELNEALTEYLTKKSLGYLKCNITGLTPDDNLNRDSVYDRMFPLVDVLRNSSLWKDFVKYKIDRDNKELIRKIGENNYKKICHCFKEFYSYSSKKDYSAELKSIIGSLESGKTR